MIKKLQEAGINDIASLRNELDPALLKRSGLLMKADSISMRLKEMVENERFLKRRLVSPQRA